MDSVYDSHEATSIASAVILKLKYPKSIAYNIHETNDRPKGEHYHFTDDEDAGKKAKKIKEVKKHGKRVRSLWLELFPDKAPPLIISRLSKYNMPKDQEDSRDYLKNGLVGDLPDVNDAHQFMIWKGMIDGNRGAMETYARMGRHIHRYLSSISKRAPKKTPVKKAAVKENSK